MKKVLLVLGIIAFVVVISQWNTLEMESNLKSLGNWLGPILYPFYLSRGKGN